MKKFSTLSKRKEVFDSNDSLEDSSPLDDNKEEIEKTFQKDSLDQVLNILASLGTTWALETIDALHQKSPTSLLATWEQLLRGRNNSLAETLEMEFVLAQHLVRTVDFTEGVRAAVIDKDRNPKWNPKNISEISHESVKDLFRPLQEKGILSLAEVQLVYQKGKL